MPVIYQTKPVPASAIDDVMAEWVRVYPSAGLSNNLEYFPIIQLKA
jgi:hypothetical protein